MFIRLTYLISMICVLTDVVIAQQAVGPGVGGGGGSAPEVGGNCSGPGPVAITCLIADGQTVSCPGVP